MKIAPEEIEFRLLKQVEADPALSQRQIASRVGVSLGKVNFCLKALINKGLLKVKNFKNADNKWAYTYILTPHGVEEKAIMTKQFLQKKMTEYDKLKHEIEELEREAKLMELARENG